MQIAIVSYERDEMGDLIAVLACGHRQHVRHKPPFIERPWVLSQAGRQKMIGVRLACKLCDVTANEADLRALTTEVPMLTAGEGQKIG